MADESAATKGQSIPPAVATLIDATNKGDPDRFVGAFTADAYVEDGGTHYRGRQGVEQWNLTDNVGVGMHFDLLSVSKLADDRYDVGLRASSRRFTGIGTMHITLRDGLISRLVIG